MEKIGRPAAETVSIQSKTPYSIPKPLSHGLVVLALIGSLAGDNALYAATVSGELLKDISYQQTGAGTPTVNFVKAGLFSSSVVGAFNEASVSFPGPSSPQGLPYLGSGEFFLMDQMFASQSAMDAAYPFGTYTFTERNSGTLASQSVQLDYTQDDYPSTIPALTAGTYSALQGLNTAASFTFDFNTFTPDPSSVVNGDSLYILNSNSSTVIINPGNLGPGATSYVLAANSLQPNTTYTYELQFNQLDNLGSDTSTAFNVATYGTFTTAAPEPGTFGMLMGAMLAFGVKRYRRARQVTRPKMIDPRDGGTLRTYSVD